MSDLAVRVEGLGKRYQLGARKRPAYGTLRESLVSGLKAPLMWRRNPPTQGHNRELWALRDVSFDVVCGEVLGIIGRNGAGKSTLLKILSRITEPTTGAADVYGRIGSLLEVGTGFHPELTGRDNIFLSGAILGMSAADIRRRFDSIAAFAEVEQFLDTPVKRYSTGMYMRLAFSVAAHLEPDVLVIDEVLAVGDREFQKKCLGKMEELATGGRTVLFVSHTLDAIARLCTRVLVIDSGRIVNSGAPAAVIGQYLTPDRLIEQAAGPWHSSTFRLERVQYFGASWGEPVVPHGPLHIVVDVTPTTPTRDTSIHIAILDRGGHMLLGFDSIDFDCSSDVSAGESVRFELSVESCTIPPGEYPIDVYLKSYSNQSFEHLSDLVALSVEATPVYGSRLFDPKWHGQMLADASMSVRRM